jgi:hypothetical protein
MNISIDLQKLLLSNIFFSDKKRNIIMDGNFSKIVYSNEWFTMNGLYVLFPIDSSGIEKRNGKSMLKYNPYNNNNLSIIQEFARLENRIIDYYKITYNCTLKSSNFLSRQLYSGVMKLYKEFNSLEIETPTQYILKISGVWESHSEVGITYKLVQVNENY